jgi:molecular chaperone DnaK
LQGEREFANDNKSLGRFILDGIAPAPRGIPQIEVTFNIDANGIVNVKATDKGTGKEQHITIQGSGNLSEADIKRMQEEAEMHAEADKKRKELVEARNHLDGLVYTSEKTLKDAGDKADTADRTALEDAIKAAKAQLESDDPELLHKHAEDLMEKVQKVGAAMYKDVPGAGEPGGSAAPEEVESTEADGSGPIEGEVVDEGGK